MIRKLVLTAAAVMLSASVAFAALTLDDAKAKGLVGEQPNGMIGAIADKPTADVATLVDSTNVARLKAYQDIAAKHGVQLEVVEAEAGAKLVSTTPAGQYIRTAAGAWQKK